MLEAHGWRVFHFEQNYNAEKRRKVGEKGMPDLLALRYFDTNCAECLWIEVKQKGKKPRKEQLDWIFIEKKKGARVWVTDSLDDFTEWYKGEFTL